MIMNRFTPFFCFGLAAPAISTRADAGISAQLAVCAVRLDPQATFGAFGGVVLSLKADYASCSNPGIPHSVVSYFCSKQATSGNCTTATAFHYSEPGLQGLYQAAIQAQVNERFVEVFFENLNSTRGQQLRNY
jgi:hypothetical protein